ncbi:protein-associating with the carboxyl-terminal domain of ezrin [Coccinella septempunctata]|uniref:protein-associating with the carboxyl-terminal domain of ezrin n=1 Tax=Coccinella septempunctata TaxID=41139 RepID=UPI001D083471|nr:protein-associating with the carboxyl-terminal domain of ezrin [Coccinella septempunctata]
MGNDSSHLAGIDIEDKAVEVADFWSQHTASVPKSKQLSNLTIFIGELFVNGPLWTIHTPLEKCSKNLMIYRHPCILKYISSWSKSSKFYLAVEHVRPLSHVYSTLSTLQLCIGLHSVLKALCFLHEKGKASHNNVCLASIYITDDGKWKLGGMEFSCKYTELSKEHLNKSKANRYAAAVDIHEEEHIQKPDILKEFVDAFAFFVLVAELLKSDASEDIPELEDFKALCRSGLENLNIDERPTLSDLLKHPFFNHEFILIHSFLMELPLKSDEEKLTFFSNLISSLRNFNENLVANQLSGLLLSRMVLLNSVAQTKVLSKILSFKQDGEEDEEDGPLISEGTFKEHVVPRILEIFAVRDAQIRLILLQHFKGYINGFSQEELQSYILPELLVGIKDTNDILVSCTLEALSTLVLILGANTVIGGKRARLFTDGRPTQTTQKSRQNSRKCSKSLAVELPDIPVPKPVDPLFISNLPERQRPDGEEVEILTDEVDQTAEEEIEWEDWEENQDLQATGTNTLQLEQTEILEGELATSLSNLKIETSKLKNKDISKIKNIQDIDELDIKNQKSKEQSDDIDFFQDMEPEIKSSTKYLIGSELENQNTNENSNKLNLVVTGLEEDGWGEEEWE